MFLILLLNLALIAFLFMLFKKKYSYGNKGSLLKHIGLFEATWTAFLFTLALFILFDIMETKQDEETFLSIATQEKMMLLSVLVGFGITHLSIFIFVVFKVLKPSVK